MYRYLMAEQFLGATFVNLVEKDIFEIPISKLNEVEKTLDLMLRERHNTMLFSTTNDIFSVVEEYNDFFKINQDYIKLHSQLMVQLKGNQMQKNIFINKLNRYFVAGIPNDVFKTVTDIIESYVGE